MRKIFRAILIFLLFLVFVNTSIFLALRFFDSIIIILDVLLLYFVSPVMIALSLSWIAGKILYPGKDFREQVIFQILIGLSLFMWLVIIIGSYTGVKEFVLLNTNKEHIIENVDEITQEQVDKAGFITLKNAELRKNEIGFYENIRKKKSGDSHITIKYLYKLKRNFFILEINEVFRTKLG